MRLDISWKLSRESPYWQVWKEGADSLRLDQDVNSAGSGHFTQWSTVQRAIENYRIFINQQVLDESRWNQPIMIHPDMDNVYVDRSVKVLDHRFILSIHRGVKFGLDRAGFGHPRFPTFPHAPRARTPL